MRSRKKLEKSLKGECSSAGAGASQAADKQRTTGPSALGVPDARSISHKSDRGWLKGGNISVDRSVFVAGEFNGYPGESSVRQDAPIIYR